jgi:phosphate acetyltransferase
MNAVIEKILDVARNADRTIVLPESQDPRVLQAARRVTDEKLARILLKGHEDAIAATAREANVSLDGIEIINQLNHPHRDEYVHQLYESRRHKGMTIDDADKLLANPVYYAGMMVGHDHADGMVAGSICPTRDTVRSALFGVGCADGNKTVSACSIMVTKVPSIGVDGALIFADTGVMPEPTSEQLADIAIAAADACEALMGVEPMVAMLSFSTKGSAYSPAIQKVIDATGMAQTRRPKLKLDGEMQIDAALIPEIAERKAKTSPVAGKANTLIFPDLNCGNIAYKLVERLGGAMALGPLLTGLAKPVNDLSRGCSVDDIVLITAITVAQAVAAGKKNN